MKPSEFYIGVLDFFAILLPGAIVTAILVPVYGDFIVWPLIAPLNGDTGKWVTFLIFAYFAGHLIFLLGSYIDYLYNALRERFNPYGNESAFRCATRIRDSLVGESEGSKYVPVVQVGADINLPDGRRGCPLPRGLLQVLPQPAGGLYAGLAGVLFRRPSNRRLCGFNTGCAVLCEILRKTPQEHDSGLHAHCHPVQTWQNTDAKLQASGVVEH